LWNEGILREREKAEDENDSTERSIIRCEKRWDSSPKVMVDK
jgi:hypothetical protein